MPAIDKLISAVRKGHKITSVRFSNLPDEHHVILKSRDGKVSLKLGKTTIPAELWMAKQTKRFRNFGINTKGYLGPNSSTNINSVEIYMAGRGWMPLTDLTVAGAIDRRRSPTKAKAKAKASPTKKPSPVKRLERQIESGKGPDTIANSNTYQTLLEVCKKWGLPTDTIAEKADMATALIVEQWKKMIAA